MSNLFTKIIGSLLNQKEKLTTLSISKVNYYWAWNWGLARKLQGVSFCKKLRVSYFVSGWWSTVSWSKKLQADSPWCSFFPLVLARNRGLTGPPHVSTGHLKWPLPPFRCSRAVHSVLVSRLEKREDGSPTCCILCSAPTYGHVCCNVGDARQVQPDPGSQECRDAGRILIWIQ